MITRNTHPNYIDHPLDNSFWYKRILVIPVHYPLSQLISLFLSHYFIIYLCNMITVIVEIHTVQLEPFQAARLRKSDIRCVTHQGLAEWKWKVPHRRPNQQKSAPARADKRDGATNSEVKWGFWGLCVSVALLNYSHPCLQVRRLGMGVCLTSSLILALFFKL